MKAALARPRALSPFCTQAQRWVTSYDCREVGKDSSRRGVVMVDVKTKSCSHGQCQMPSEFWVVLLHVGARKREETLSFLLQSFPRSQRGRNRMLTVRVASDFSRHGRESEYGFSHVRHSSVGQQIGLIATSPSTL